MENLPEDFKNVKGIFTDIDGTFNSDDDPVVYSSVLARFEELRSAGFKIVCVTGRSAGWCNAIVNLWPIDGVVGENGAFAFIKKGKTVEFIEDDFAHPVSVVLEIFDDHVFDKFPNLHFADDQPYRLTDLAIDYKKSGIDASKVKPIIELFRENGITAKASSIHLNCWSGTHSKLTMVSHLLSNVYTEKHDWAYFGDSPNDEVMFKHFPKTSVGVKSVAKYDLEHMPAVITEGNDKEGFLEFTELFLK